MDLSMKISGEMGFDSSLHSSMDAKLSPTEYKDRLETLLQPILDQRFPNSYGKKQIQTHHDRISFACPICGDSMQSDHKKRGNFILKGKHAGFFKCHNCGEFKRVDKFFSEYKIELKLDAINYLMDNIGDFKSYGDAKYDMSMLLDMGSIDKYAIDRQEFLRYNGLVEVKDSPVWSWLKNRHQYNQDKFLYNEEQNYIYILNLTQSGKILGAQRRFFKGNNRFNSFTLSKLHEQINQPLLLLSDEQINYLDTLSMIYNICLIDFSKQITLFEGPMDAFLFKNSIANTGANKEIPISIPLRYFYDSDETGKRKALQHIDQNHEVFLWDKFIRENNLPYKTKWDLNDVVIYNKKHNIITPDLQQYFSGDPLDALDI